MAGYEIPTSTEKRTLVCFVLDVSGSMVGDPITELNTALNEFVHEMANDITFAHNIEVSVVTFDSNVKVLQDAILSDEITHNFQLRPSGTTALVDGVRKGIEIVNDRKQYYKQYGLLYTRAFIVLVTDGAPDSDQDVSGLKKQIENDTKNGKYVFMSLGVTGADMNVLQNISGYLETGRNPDGSIKGYELIKPLPLKGTAFKGFFQFIAQSSKAASTQAGTATTDGIDTKIMPDWLLGV